MHRRQLLILYAGLSIAAGLLAWRLEGEWQRANLRYKAWVRLHREAPAVLPPRPPERPALPSGEVVAKNLFTPDRNNEIAQAEKPQPPPPIPVVFGTINLGSSYEALMAEAGQTATRSFHRVKNGEQIGVFTVVEIRDEKVVIEFQGQKTTLDVYQSARSVPLLETRSAPVAAPVVETGGSSPPPSAASNQASSAPASSGASAQPSPGPDVRVTIEGNRRRFERQTPFGPQVWYENIGK